jgi:hypothetical protein
MKRSHFWLITILALQLVNGFVVTEPDRIGPLLLLPLYSLGVAIPAAIYSWCQADIAERNLPYPAGTPILVGIIPPVGLLIYFARTRPPLGAIAGITKSALFIGLCIASMQLGAYVRTLLFV